MNIPSTWNKCFVSLMKKGGGTYNYESIIDNIDISGGDRQISSQMNLKGGIIRKLEQYTDFSIRFTGYPIGIGLNNNHPDKGFSQLFNGTTDTSGYLLSSPSKTPDLFRVVILWTNYPVSSATDAVTQESGTTFKDDVITIRSSPPSSPSTGDRYLVSHSGATGSWAGLEDHIEEWNGSSWTDYVPSDNDAVFVINNNIGLMYDASSNKWVTEFGFYQAYRYIINDCIITGINKNNSGNVLQHTISLSATMFDIDGNPNVIEESTIGKDDLPAVSAYT